MRESLNIDPLLREYLEQRRGLTSDEVDRLLVEWSNHGSLTDFLASKALIDRTTAKMLITAQKGYLSSSPDEIRTVLGIRVKPRRREKSEPQSELASEPTETAAAQIPVPGAGLDPPSPLSADSPPEVTPPTQPQPAISAALPPKETEPKEPPLPIALEKTAPPTAEPPKPKKGSGRRGFLGASEEELRHILGSRAVGPAAGMKQEASGAHPKSPLVEVSTPAVNDSSPPKAVPPGVVAAAVPVPAAAAVAVAVAERPVSRPPRSVAVPSPAVAAPLPVADPQNLPAKPKKDKKVSGPTSGPFAYSDPQIQLSVNSAPDLLPLKPSALGGDPKVGTYIDRYYLEESLGEGATATIFRSFHKLLRIPVAIKSYKREAMKDDPLGTQRFLSEAQILIRLEHPNIVRVLDIAVRDSAPYIVFEYVGELSLQGMIQNMGHLPPLRVAQIGAQVAAALDVASSNGLLHRDVKPDNILIRKDGLAKLADFGIATHRASDGRTVDELARAGLISGTPQYISPEQITTPDKIDFRADMYSLGATLYHAACGHPPFERDSLDELLHAQLEDQPIPLLSLDPNFDSELSEIIDRMLHKEPTDRFPSLLEIRKRLDSAARRIQSEVSARRKNAISSGAISVVNAPSSDEVGPYASSDESTKGVGAQARQPNQVSKRPSVPPKSSPTDSQLVLREPSNIIRTVVVAIAMLMACLVIYVLIRTAR